MLLAAPRRLRGAALPANRTLSAMYPYVQPAKVLRPVLMPHTWSRTGTPMPICVDQCASLMYQFTRRAGLLTGLWLKTCFWPREVAAPPWF